MTCDHLGMGSTTIESNTIIADDEAGHERFTSIRSSLSQDPEKTTHVKEFVI
jgi:hypothetical protein